MSNGCVALALLAMASIVSSIQPEYMTKHESYGLVKPNKVLVAACYYTNEKCEVAAGRLFHIEFEFIQAKPIAHPVVRLEIGDHKVYEEGPEGFYDVTISNVRAKAGDLNKVWMIQRIPRYEVGKTVNLTLSIREQGDKIEDAQVRVVVPVVVTFDGNARWTDDD